MKVIKIKMKKKTENNAIRTNYDRAKVDNAQKNSKCRLYGDWEETDNHHLIRKFTELIKKIAREAWLGEKGDGWLFFFLFNGISTFVGYLMPKLFS